MSIRSKVFVFSAFRGEAKNLELAEKYCKYIESKGGAPFAPHLLYPRFLGEETEREVGIECGLAWLEVADIAAGFVVDGVITEGMKKEAQMCIDHEIPIKWYIYDGVHILHQRGLACASVPSKEDFLDPGRPQARTNKTLDDLADKLKAGASYESLQGDLDAALGIDDTEENHEADAAWEDVYRHQND